MTDEFKQVDEFTEEYFVRQRLIADDLFADWTELAEEADEDYIGVAYALWVSFAYVLMDSGWSIEQLQHDLMVHLLDEDRIVH